MNSGTWITSGYKPGDLIIYDFGAPGIDHIGICYAARDDVVFAIEGNTAIGNNSNGGEVKKRRRSIKTVVGACRPAYTADMPASRILEIARGELGTKEFPRNSNNVRYNTEYYGREVSGSSYPWCVAFVWWVFKCAGMFAHFYGGNKTASCTVLATFYGYKKSSKGSETTVTITLSVLKKGNKGDQVKTVQRLVNAFGYDCGTVDGDFGPKTAAAVKAFQNKSKLEADGVVGAKTWASLLT